MQMAGLEELQRTLDEDVLPILVQLEHRPLVDVERITQKLDATIDAVDRVMQRRIPMLMTRRWWIVWLWFVAGIALGVSGCWWTTQTPQGQQVLAWAWRHVPGMPRAPVVQPMKRK